MTVLPNEFFESLATLGMMKQGEEWLAKFGRGNLIQSGSHLAVTGDDANTINPMQTFRFVATSFVKSQ